MITKVTCPDCFKEYNRGDSHICNRSHKNQSSYDLDEDETYLCSSCFLKIPKSEKNTHKCERDYDKYLRGDDKYASNGFCYEVGDQVIFRDPLSKPSLEFIANISCIGETVVRINYTNEKGISITRSVMYEDIEKIESHLPPNCYGVLHDNVDRTIVTGTNYPSPSDEVDEKNYKHELSIESDFKFELPIRNKIILNKGK